MKKTHSKKLALRTQTVAALSADDLRSANGASYTNVGFTTQLNNAWTTIMLGGGAGWTTIVH